ncbi:unnamed protein product [Nyctereutes procyonoides]|uniref:(raccoon dog) hypothetical protein n=1 Tax=Nyctereutes procyonoides TaxID=34880 RepID=A0A811YCF5_NYCPR|nr:unnamed protein product [Nyctereutes procyonoides]
MAGRRGQRGAGRSAAGRLRPRPPRPPRPPPPRAPRPAAGLPLSSPRGAALGGRAGVQPRRSRRASPPPPPQVRRAPGAVGSLPLASVPQLARRSTVSFEKAGRSPFPAEAFPVNSFSFQAWNSSQTEFLLPLSREWLSKTEVNPVYAEYPGPLLGLELFPAPPEILLPKSFYFIQMGTMNDLKPLTVFNA